MDGFSQVNRECIVCDWSHVGCGRIKGGLGGFCTPSLLYHHYQQQRDLIQIMSGIQRASFWEHAGFTSDREGGVIVSCTIFSWQNLSIGLECVRILGSRGSCGVL